ncbi:heterokaryon incompatibility protein-domain-containing protein [Xylaria sp. FL0064]|nr:heterokaryon incompatibility protein-domain-containing protein [Xylaria sp. FL0064]
MASIAGGDICSPQRVLYFPLDHTLPQIRLIKILPFENTDNEQVSCQLKTIELSEDTRYAALSYVWGDPKITEHIKVNGIDLPVTTNLASALRHFRRYGFPQNQETKDLQYLWVDAICINQDEGGISERNHQVALMSKIYSSATSVLSWLGTHNSEKALKIIHEIAPVIGATPDRLHIPMNAERIYSGFRWLYSTLAPPTTPKGQIPEEWVSIHALSTSVYWERRWVVQEMALARSTWDHWFICGNASATFHELRMFNQLLQSIGKRPYPESDGPRALDGHKWDFLSKVVQYCTLPTEMINELRVRPQNKPGDITQRSIFYAACIIATTSSASRPHDCVYAILGLCPNHNIKPDYGKPVREVYLGVISSDEAGEWDLYFQISGRGLNIKDEHNLPSWLPNLSKLHNIRASDITAKKSVPVLSISPVPRVEVLSENILCVDGVICDHVELVKHLDFVLGNDKHNTNALAKLCIDYLAEFVNIAESSCLASSPEREWQPRHIAGKLAGRRPLKALLDVLDWRDRHYRRKSSGHCWGASSPELSSEAWYFFVFLRFYFELTDEEEQDARRRLSLPAGMAPSDYLKSYLDLVLLPPIDVKSSLALLTVNKEF